MLGVSVGVSHADTVAKTTSTGANEEKNIDEASLPASQALNTQSQSSSMVNGETSTTALSAGGDLNQDIAKSETNEVAFAGSIASQNSVDSQSSQNSELTADKSAVMSKFADALVTNAQSTTAETLDVDEAKYQNSNDLNSDFANWSSGIRMTTAYDIFNRDSKQFKANLNFPIFGRVNNVLLVMKLLIVPMVNILIRIRTVILIPVFII